MFLVISVCGGLTRACLVNERGQQDVDLTDDEFVLTSGRYVLARSGGVQHLTFHEFSQDPVEYELVEGLNILAAGKGNLYWLEDRSYLRECLSLLGIKKDVLPDYTFADYTVVCNKSSGSNDQSVACVQSGRSGWIARIEMGLAATKSEFFSAISGELNEYYDERLCVILSGDEGDENLREATNWLKSPSEKWRIEYRGPSNEYGYAWLMAVGPSFHMAYKPWESRRNMGYLYALHLICKKFGWRRVLPKIRFYYNLNDQQHNLLHPAELEVIEFFEAIFCVISAANFLINRGLRAISGPAGNKFSFEGSTTGFVSYKDMPPETQAEILFRKHKDLPKELLARLSTADVFHGFAFYPRFMNTVRANGAISFFDDDGKEHSGFPVANVVECLNLDKELKSLHTEAVGSVQEVVNEPRYGSGHVVGKRSLVLRHDSGAVTNYLLVIHGNWGGGLSDWSSKLFELTVSGSNEAPNFILALHDGPYMMVGQDVVVKP